MVISNLIGRLKAAGATFKVVDGEYKVVLGKPISAELKAQLIEHKTELKDYLSGILRQGGQDVLLAASDDYARLFPLSFAQQRLWFIDHFQQGSQEYNIPAAFELTGDFDVSAAAQVLNTIVRRHAILRTVYQMVEGEVWQRILPEMTVPLETTDLCSLSAPHQQEALAGLLSQYAAEPFDLSSGPVIRCHYIQLSRAPEGQRGVLSFTMHHIASDGWSMSILIREFLQLYLAIASNTPNPLPELPVQYADFALWQVNWLTGERLEKQISYWQQQLEDMPQVHSLPLDYERSGVKQHRGARVTGQLDGSVILRIRELANKHKLTPFMLLHGALALVLSRYSNSDDIVVGTPVANRMRAELEGLVGCFVNTLVLRLNTDNVTLGEYWQHVRQVHLDAQDHQDLPFEQLLEHLPVNRSQQLTPLFQLLLTTTSDFGVNRPSQSEQQRPSVSVLANQAITVKFDVEINLALSEHSVLLRWDYDTSLFNESRISQLNEDLMQLLTVMADRPEIDSWYVKSLPILSEAQTDYLVNTLNDTRQPYADELCIHELFEQSVKEYPERTALVFKDKKLSYRQLNDKANQLAHYLREHYAVGPDRMVGISLERSLEMVIAVLGVLKAGAAYVALDPQYPIPRLHYMLEDASPQLVLTQTDLAELWSDSEVQQLMLDGFGSMDTVTLFDSYSSTNIPKQALGLTAAHLAYVIYTSGSTGRPKGVLIEHRNTCAMLSWTGQEYSRQDLSSVLLSTSLNFDLSVFEMFAPLCFGGQGVIVENALALLEHPHDISLINTVPSVAKALLEQKALPDKRYCINLAGEALSRSLVNALLEQPTCSRVYNLYGPSEDTTYSTFTSFTQPSLNKPAIGKVISNSQAYVLGQAMELLPFGTTGELYLGGDGVARGYLNRPELTAERFIANPYAALSCAGGDRLYSTGDLVRYLPGGELEYIGRIDHQVKIRGFRIELGEIEHQLELLPEIDSALVIVSESTEGDPLLVAYVRAATEALTHEFSADKQAFARRLKSVMAAQLPAYMVPAIYIQVSEWPLTPNGKIDRKALPEADSSLHQGHYVAPATETEKALTALWAGLLKVAAETLNVSGNFFDLGGHSLLAVRMVAEIRRKMGFELSIRSLFESPTIRELAALIDQAPLSPVRPPVTAVTGETDVLPLSFAQQRVWVIDQMRGGSSEYNMQAVFEVCGALNLAIVNEVLTTIIARHRILRTVYVEADGVALQKTEPAQRFQLRQYDLSHLCEAECKTAVEAFISQDRQAAFDLSCDVMLRASYLSLTAGNGVLVFNVHHIAADGWSVEILVREFCHLYLAYDAAAPDALTELDIQYGDYAVWQQQYLTDAVLAEQLSYWRQQLEAVPVIHSLPLQGPRPAQKENRGRRITGTLGQEVSKPLLALARAYQLTPFMLVHGALALVLASHSHSQDIVVGTPVANRLQAELESLIGLFVNTLVLRVNTGHLLLCDYLAHVREVHLAAQANQDAPLEQLIDMLNLPRSSAHTPLFQIMLSTKTSYGQADHSLKIPGVTLTPLSNRQVQAKFDLDINIDLHEQGVMLQWVYDEDLFSEAQILRLNEHMTRLLTGLAQVPEAADIKLRSLPILSAQEIDQQLFMHSDNQMDLAVSACIHELFEQRAAEHPDKPALLCGGMTLSYRNLNERANVLAHYLMEHCQVRTDTLVGLCIERSPEMVIGILAILKAGGAYVPLDPAYPPQRLAYMLADSGVEFVLSQSALMQALPELTGQWLAVDTILSAPQAKAASINPGRDRNGLQPDHLAYVIYTSGSTGEPKGVMIEHASVTNLITQQARKYGYGADDVGLLLANFVFDASVEQLFLALSTGARIVIPNLAAIYNPAQLQALCIEHGVTHLNGTPSQLALIFQGDRGLNTMPGQAALYDPVQLQALCIEHGVTHLDGTPSQLELILQNGNRLSRLRRVVCGGEPLSARIRELVGTTVLWNAYGPTEATVTSLIHRCDSRSLNTVGRPVGNLQALVLDQNQQIVPLGSIGELYLSGIGLARGYLNRPELTKDRFISNPFYRPAQSHHYRRLYKTGDLVRYLPSAELEFLGRRDEQVKIRGLRIELGEIEHHLTQLRHVDSALVIAKELQAGHKTLVAYIKAENSCLTHESEADLIQGIKTELFTRLPDYMVPANFVLIDHWPLTPSGKIEIKALPEPVCRVEYVAPEGDIEHHLMTIWAGLLKQTATDLSVEANFFELGGDSILSIQLVSRSAAQGLYFSVKDVFNAQTIRQLAKRVTFSSSVNAQQEPCSGHAPLLPIQAEFFADETELHHYNQAIMLATPAEFEPAALEALVTALYQRHDVLRLKFYRDSSAQWQAEFIPFSAAMAAQATEIRDWPDGDRATLEAQASEIQRSLAPEQGVLMKAVYFSHNTEGRLLLVVHHLVVDGVSWRIILEDLETWYQQYVQGKVFKTQAKSSSFQQWGLFLQGYAKSETLRTEKAYWQQVMSPVVAPLAGECAKTDYGSRRNWARSLNESKTVQLLGTCNQLYRTQINELLLSALLIAWNKVSGSASLRLDLESHGREHLTDTLDLSQTVGWFTCIYPLRLDTPANNDLGPLICSVKEACRAVPHRGIGYGLLKAGDADFQMYGHSEILFNYLGQFGQHSQQQHAFAFASESSGDSISQQRKDPHALVLTALVANGRFELSLRAEHSAYPDTVLSQLADEYLAALELIIEHCLTTRHGILTPADFPLAQMSIQECLEWQSGNDIDKLYPATGMQKGLLFQGMLDKGSYVTQTLLELSELNVTAFQQAWSCVGMRHDIFRTKFVGLDSGNIHQLVCKEFEPVWEYIDLSGYTEEMRQQQLVQLKAQDKQREFDPAVAPLMHMTLVKLAENRQVFIWTNHHALLDGWCLPLIFAEVVSFYRGLVRGEPTSLEPVPSYQEYAGWFAKQDIGAAKDFWHRQMADFNTATPLPFVGKNIKPNSQVSATIESGIVFDLLQTQALAAQAKRCKTTVNVLLNAAWALLLSRYSSEPNVVFGAVTSGRPAELPGVEKMLGLFINTLPVSATIQEELRVQDWLLQLHKQQVESEQYSYLPLADIQKLVSDGQSLFDSLIVFENYPVNEAIARNADDSGLQVVNVECNEGTHYGLTVLAKLTDRFSIRLMANSTLLSVEQLEQLTRHLDYLLQALCKDADQLIKDVPMLTAAEYQRLIYDVNAQDAAFPDNIGIHQLFEQEAAAHPDAVALMFRDRSFSYREVNEQANRLAGYLLAQGLRPEELVGLCLNRSAELIIAMLAILKAGGAYVPIDPSYPSLRIQSILDDCQLRFLFTLHEYSHCVADAKCHLIYLNNLADYCYYSTENRLAHAGQSEHIANNLCYVIYTSGSTGKPKGVMVEHRSVVRLVRNNHYVPLDHQCRMLQVCSIGFDVATFEIWGSLLNGGLLVLYPEDIVDVAVINAAVERYQINTLWLTSGLFEQWSLYIPQSSPLRYLLAGGDVVSPLAVKRTYEQLPEVTVINGYGPTENTSFTCCYAVPRDFDWHRSVPLGMRINGTKTYILDEKLRPVPKGALGGLYAGGPGVARGYLNKPELTAERFIDSPFEPGDRLYQIGDLVRWLDDGTIEFHGRNDSQVKIRGFRIELGEVEAQLRALSGVDDAVVLVKEIGLSKQLFAYVATKLAESTAFGQQIRHQLADKLPGYMLPSGFILLPVLPLTAHGKVDKRALPEPTPQSDSGYLAPQNEVESVLADIWQQVLKIERVGREDNFFAIGGDSILSIQVVAKANQQGIRISTRQLYEAQTIARLAASVGETLGYLFSQEAVTGSVGLLPVQQQFFAETQEDHHHYNQALLLNVPADFEFELLQQIINALYRRHDVLRMTFHEAEGQYHSTFQPVSAQLADAACILEYLPSEQVAGFVRERCSYYQQSFVLEQGPLFKAILFKGLAQTKLFLLAHHLVVDAVSWRIMLADLELAYQQHHHGGDIRLFDKTSSLKQWSDALYSYAGSADLLRERAYWLSQYQVPVPALMPELCPDGPVLMSSSRTIRLGLNKEETADLLTLCPSVYRTHINELLLSGLYLGMQQWRGVKGIRVTLEGHGREEVFDGLDVTQTVGWFTTMYPLAIYSEESGVGAVINQVKDQYRAIPRHGLGFGVLRYLTRDPLIIEQADSCPGGILFNYLGQLDQALTTTSQFSGANEAIGPSLSLAMVRKHPLVLNGQISGGKLEFVLEYSEQQYHSSSMQALADKITEGLRTVITHCRVTKHGVFTKSDFPLAKVDNRLLAAWLESHQVEQLYPATGMQVGLIYQSALEAGSYITQTVLHFADLDPERFRVAWEHVVRRHPIFRTAFVGIKEANVHQLVHPMVRLPWRVADLTAMSEGEQKLHLDELRFEDKYSPFDFATPPLMRMTLVLLAANKSTLIWSHHHALLDGWCIPLIFAEVTDCYQQLLSGDSVVLQDVKPFQHYIEWLSRQDQQQAREFWQQQLQGVMAPTPLPVAPSKDSEMSVERHRIEFSEAQTLALSHFAQSVGVTVNVLLEAAWGILLARYSGETTVVFGAVTSGRPAQLSGVDKMLGLFINTLAVVIRTDTELTVGDWLRLIQQHLVGRESHNYLALHEVQRLSGCDQALFNSLLVFENYPVDEALGNKVQSAQLAVRGFEVHEGTNYDITVTAILKRQLSITLELKNKTLLAPVGEHLKFLLLELPQCRDNPVQTLEILSPAEQELVLQSFNDTQAGFPENQFIHLLFEQQAELRPQALAVQFGGQEFSYQALNQMANQLADYLRRKGVRPRDLVGICAERSVEMVVAILAVLKAGAAYVPLDPDYPPSRFDFIVEDTGIKHLLSHKGLTEGRTVADDVLQIALDHEDVMEDIARCTTANLPAQHGQSVTDLAYVIYTSGSTGKPKGVMVEHRALVNRIDWMQKAYQLTAADRCLQKTPYSFDVSVWEFLWTLSYGAGLIIAKPGGHKDPQYLSDLIRKTGVTLMHFVPSMLNIYMNSPDVSFADQVRYVFCSGEALEMNTVEKVQEKAPHVALHNLYGPTEAAIDVSYFDCSRANQYLRVPIGRPIQNTQLLVLDQAFKPCPLGVVGELFIGGAGLARGYLNQEQLTQEKFVTLSLGQYRHARFYRTGDLVRYLPDGNLDSVGRTDFQVKIRGFRIEIGEIEHHLHSFAEVDTAVVVVTTDAQDNKRLVAYLTLTTVSTDKQALIANVRRYLYSRLPEYMVPSAFEILNELPLSNSGKIDRKRLPAPEQLYLSDAHQAPETETECAVAGIWSELLSVSVEKLGVNSSFFESGGNSLQAMQLAYRLTELFGCQVNVADIFTCRNIRQLSLLIDALRFSDEISSGSGGRQLAEYDEMEF